MVGVFVGVPRDSAWLGRERPVDLAVLPSGTRGPSASYPSTCPMVRVQQILR